MTGRTDVQISLSPCLPISFFLPVPSSAALGGLKLDHNLSSTLLRRGERTIAEASATIEVRQARSKQLALAAARTAEDNRGEDIVVLDMRDDDRVRLLRARHRQQPPAAHAISEEIDRVLEGELSDQRMGIEGYNESRWILLDYGSVVVHLFDAETRDYYALEDLWGEAERVPLPWQKQKTGRRGDGETRRLRANDHLISRSPCHPTLAHCFSTMNILATLRDRFAPRSDDARHRRRPTCPSCSRMVLPSQDAKFGDYQANCAMPLGKRLGKPPREIAAQLVAALDVADLCEPPEIAGPGFINLRLKDDWLAEQLAATSADVERLGVRAGRQAADDRRRLLVAERRQADARRPHSLDRDRRRALPHPEVPRPPHDQRQPSRRLGHPVRDDHLRLQAFRAIERRWPRTPSTS